jgi:hypothetical protein
MDKKKILVIVPILLLATVGLAIYLTGWTVTGSFIATQGTKKYIQEEWNISITSDSNITNGWIYTNPDGSKTVNWFLTDDIESSDPECTYEPNKDVKFYVNVNGVEYLLTSSGFNETINEGSNQFNITVEPHTARCSLTGNYTIGFDIP